MNQIKILIIDDHALVGQAWKVILEAEKQFMIVDVVSNMDTTMELIQKKAIDVVLLDINMSPVSGFEMAELIKKLKPGIKILAVSMHDQPGVVRKMIKCGANGFVSKNAKKEEMTQAIFAIMSEKRFISNDIQEKMAYELINEHTAEDSKKSLTQLTEKEKEVVKLVKSGFTSKEIAEKMNISYKTVQVHRHNILKKLNQRNTASLLSLLNDSNFVF